MIINRSDLPPEIARCYQDKSIWRIVKQGSTVIRVTLDGAERADVWRKAGSSWHREQQQDTYDDYKPVDGTFRSLGDLANASRIKNPELPSARQTTD